MAIGPVVLGGPGIGAAYDELSRTTRSSWKRGDRVGRPEQYEFVGAEQDIVVMQGVIYPLRADVGGAAAQGLGRDLPQVGPRISDLGAGQLGGAGAIELLRRMVRSGRPWPIVMGSGEVCGLWVVLKVEERLSNLRHDGVAAKSQYRIELRLYGMSLSEYAQRQNHQNQSAPREEVSSTIEYDLTAPVPSA